MVENSQQSDVSTESTADNRVYYNYGNRLIDLKHFIHNLNTNLDRFLSAKSNWSEALKLVFRERFLIFKEGLQNQLESGSNRFHTDYDGVTIDSDGVLSDGKDVVYIDKDGSMYNDGTLPDSKHLLVFDASKELGNYANRIMGAIMVKGFTKEYYDKLAEAKLKKAQRAQSLGNSGDVAAASAQNDQTNTYNPETSSFLASLKQYPSIYDSAENKFKWDYIQLADITQRLDELSKLLDLYLTLAKDATVDFTNSSYGSKDNFISAIQAAKNSLADGYLTTDNEALKGIGLDDDFITNWFSEISAEERAELEEIERKRTELETKIDSNSPVISARTPVQNNALLLGEIPTYQKVIGNQERDITYSFDQFLNNIGINPAGYHDNPTQINSLLYNIRSNVANKLMAGTYNLTIINQVKNLIALDNTFQDYNIDKNFLKGDDGLYYLNYLNYKKGVVIVYNPQDNSIFLKKSSEAKDSPIYQLLLRKANDPSKDSVYKHALGGKFQSGGTFGDLLAESLKNLQGDNPEAFNHRNAKLGWNATNSILSSEEANEWKSEDTARVLAMAANIGAIFDPEPISGAVINVGASVGDLYADLKDKGVSGGDAAKNFVTNLGLDALGLIEGGDLIKVGRNIQKSAKLVTKGLALWGILEGVKNKDQILLGLANVYKGDFSRENLMYAGQGIMLLAQAVAAGKSHILAKKQFKDASSLIVEFQTKDGNRQAVRFSDPDIVEKLKLHRDNPEEINKILTGLGYKDAKVNTSIGNGFYSYPIGMRLPRSNGNLRSPIYIKRRASIIPAEGKTLFGLPHRGEGALKHKRPATEEVVEQRPAETPSELPITERPITELPAEQVVQPELKTGTLTDEILKAHLDREGLHLRFLGETARIRKEELALADAEVARVKKELETVSLDVQTKLLEAVLGLKVNTLDGKVITSGTMLHNYSKDLDVKVQIEAKRTLDEANTKIDKALAEFKNETSQFEGKSELTSEDKEALVNARKKLQTAIQNAYDDVDRAKVIRDSRINDLLGLEEILKEIRKPRESAKEEVRKAEADRKNLEENEDFDKERTEKTGWGDYKKDLEKGIVIGDTKYVAPEELMAGINKRLRYYNKEGGILKAQEGAYLLWYSGLYGLKTLGNKDLQSHNLFADKEKLFGHNEDFGLEQAARRNLAYTSNSDLVRSDLLNYYDKNKYATLKEFVRAYNNDAAQIRKTWGNPDGSISATDHHANTLKGMRAHNLLFRKMFANRSSNNANATYNIGYQEGDIEDIMGTSTWMRRMDRYQRDWDALTEEEKKSRTHKITLSDGTTGYVYKKANGDIDILPSSLPKNNVHTPSEPEDEYEEEPGFDDLDTRFGGKDKAAAIKPNIFEGIAKKVPILSEYLRNVWLNRLADKLTNMALEGTKPFLQSPYEIHRKVYGNLRAKAEGEKAAALLNSMASRPLTSDGALLTAALFEAKTKGQLYIDAGNKADDDMIRDTSEKAWAQEKENVYNAWKIAMDNRRSLATTEADRAKIRHAGESVKVNNTNSFWMNMTKLMNDKIHENEQLSRLANLKDFVTLATMDPKAVGINDVTDDEMQVLQSGKTYTELTDPVLKEAYLSIRKKILRAESNYQRLLLGLPKGPFEDLIASHLDVHPIISNPAAFQQGGLITVAKIKEKIKNADRHLKNIHKLIDSLDKKLDRISRSMYGIGKVSQLR